MPLPCQAGPAAGTELTPGYEQAQLLYLRYGQAKVGLVEDSAGGGGKEDRVPPPFFLGPQSKDYLPREREGEGSLPLQVEPEWRNEL